MVNKKNLKYSILEGSCFALMFGLGESYLSTLGEFFKYSATQISILSSLPIFLGALIQLGSNTFAKHFKSMKRLVVALSLIQSLLWILLIILINITDSYWVILLWSVGYFLIASAMGPVWISWIGYLVPKRIRSNYHANRNKIINTLIFLSILAGGLILQIAELKSIGINGFIVPSFLSENKILAFSVMFAIAAVGRFLSTYYLNKKDDAGNADDGDAYSYKNILQSRQKMLFIAYNTSIHFAVMLFGPLFTIYILRTMELGHLVLSFCMAAWWVGNIFSSRFWGRLGKSKGNLFLLKATTILMTILPLMWFSVYYFNYEGRIIVSLIINVLAGISFAGFNLSLFNFLYEISDEKEVVKISSLVNCIKGIGIFIGALIAGTIVDSETLKNFTSNYNFTSIQLSMLISSMLRFMSYFILTKIDFE